MEGAAAPTPVPASSPPPLLVAALAKGFVEA